MFVADRLTTKETALFTQIGETDNFDWRLGCAVWPANELWLELVSHLC